MRLLHVPAAARRSGLDVLLLGFVAGIVLTITTLSLTKDGASQRVVRHQSSSEDPHVPLYHHHHHHGHRSDDDVKVVDLTEQDRHKHTGVGGSGCTYVWKAVAHRHISGGVLHRASTIADCQAACVNDTSCVGVDFNDGHQCFIIDAGVPGQGMPLIIGEDDEKKQQEEKGCVHFDLKRTCGSAADDDTIAESLRRTVRVLCWVMTTPSNHMSRAVHVQATWGRRCNVLLFVTEKDDVGALSIMKVDVATGREHLTAKTMSAFDHVYEHHRHEADWFMKADDDTYVIVENLRYFLSSHDPSEPVFFGHHFKTIVRQGYFSGGAGYVLSKEALRRLAHRGKGECREDMGAEDAEMGHCMERLGVKTGDSRDSLGRSRFHCFNPETHIHGGYPDWYLQYDKYGAKKGVESISDYAITFHYVSVEQLYNLDFYVYHLRPYGVVSGLQELNQQNDHDDHDESPRRRRNATSAATPSPARSLLHRAVRPRPNDN